MLISEDWSLGEENHQPSLISTKFIKEGWLGGMNRGCLSQPSLTHKAFALRLGLYQRPVEPSRITSCDDITSLYESNIVKL